MPVYPANNNQMVWCAAQAKFLIFISNGSIAAPGGGGVGHVLTYDPSSKVLAEALFSGQSSAYVLGAFDAYGFPRSNCGTVVNTNSDSYFVTAWDYASLTNARIWKFRRN